MARFSSLAFGSVLLAIGCAPSEPEPPPPEGPVGEMIAAAASAGEVPADLMIAIGHVEGGLKLPWTRHVGEHDEVPVAGVLELRHGRFDSLARGAELTGRSELELQNDLAAGTDAGARVLDDLAREDGLLDRGDLAAWADVVERLSGHLSAGHRADYRARVFKVLRFGGDLRARDGEVIRLREHPEVPLSLTLSPPAPEPQGTPEYAGAEWFETSCTDKCNTSRNAAVSMIAIHDTEGGWDASVATLQNDPGKSVHYIIDADGSRVGQFIPESYNGWHVGNSYYNNRMIGIEHVGFSGQDDYATALYERSADLVKDIAARNGLTVDRSTLIAHQEVPNGNQIPESSPPCTDSPGSCVQNANYGGASHHTDPGVYWEWCQYMEIAGSTCKCNDAYDLWNCVHDLSMMVRCPAGDVEIVHCADACVVEPIGTDDHCTPVVETGAGGAGGGSPPSTGNGSGGDLGGGGDDGLGLDEPTSASSCGCAVPGSSERGGGSRRGSSREGAGLGAGLALALAAWRRRARGRARA